MATDIEVNRSIALWVTECRTCGVPFAFPRSLKENLWQNGGYYSCPNGHRWGWNTGHQQDEIEKRQAEIVRLQEIISVEQLRSRRLENDLLDKVKEAKRLARRAKAGVCSQCHRSFINVAQHMATQH